MYLYLYIYIYICIYIYILYFHVFTVRFRYHMIYLLGYLGPGAVACPARSAADSLGGASRGKKRGMAAMVRKIRWGSLPRFYGI